MPKAVEPTKFVGCAMTQSEVARIEQEMARRLAKGLPASRALLLREAVRSTFPEPAVETA